MNSVSRRTSPRLPGPEGPVAIPELAADRVHACPPDRSQAGFAGEALDVPVRKAVAFLASDEAGYITGQVLGVDGGLAMM